MIQNLIELSIRKRAIVVVGFVFIALLSVFSIKTARVDAIPDIGENQQIVFTEWAGRSPKDIEEQVTYPLSMRHVTWKLITTYYVSKRTHEVIAIVNSYILFYQMYQLIKTYL